MDEGCSSLEVSDTELEVRGRGYLKGLSDLEQIVVKNDGGVPVLLKDVARVELTPDERRGITELNGEGEVVSGIALQRFGENALSVIQHVKDRLAEMAASLPEGVRIEAVYDRSNLIYRAIETLKRTLIEESLIVALVCMVFLLHARSAFVAIITLPLGVLIAYICMWALGLSSNIMSLGGIAIAIGAMVDAAIVMIENAHKRLERAAPGKPRREILVEAAIEVGPALFFSLLIITVSFLPIFALEAQEGRLFKPLAYTKTFAMGAAALLSILLVPALMTIFVRGRIMPEHKNPVNRFLIWVYRPVIRLALKFKAATILIALAVLGVSLWPASKLGSEFMPNLNEGTLFYMPVTLPGISVTKAAELLQTQDKIIKSFPEVESVWGKAGRASTATDPAPTEMIETVINLKPEDQWRSGMTVDKLIAEMDKSLQFPGVSNAWTMPIKARIDMLSTGIRTPVGVKVYGKDLAEMEKLARKIEVTIRKVPGTATAYAERAISGYYLNVDPDRAQLARYGLMIADVQGVIAMALGAEPVTTTVEGRERYTVSIRYPRDYRSTPESIATDVLIPLPNGGTVPLGEVAKISLAQGPSSIRTEDAQLALYIFVDLRDRDLGSYVADAQKAVAAEDDFPPGYYATWSGQFEYYQRAKARLQVVVPVTILIIFLLLYLNFRRITETLIVMLSVPFALVGGFWLMWWLGFNFSVAVAVGFIALAGVAAETGVVMLIYLDNGLTERKDQRRREGRPFTGDDLYAAIMSGAVERVRPKMMTVAAIMAGLLPIMWSHGTGAEVMQRIAVPMIGGMVSSTALTLVVIPAIYAVIKGFALRRETVEPLPRAAFTS
jgi:Cu(I)/Ag(I) efflux system membrane protein CusA/SilA